MATIFNYNEVEKALKLYKESDIISFATDTVYGIGANVFNREAIDKIYATKHRPNNKPLAILCANKDQILEVAKEIPKDIEKLIDLFMPGALTVILPKKDIVPNYVTSNLNTVGVRIPNHDTALKILEAIGPLATTSANFSGEESLNSGKDVISLLGDEIDLIIDGGNKGIGVPSTVVMVENNQVKLIREGSISKQQIESALNKKI